MQDYEFQAVAHWVHDRAWETPAAKIILCLPGTLSIGLNTVEEALQSYDPNFFLNSRTAGRIRGEWENDAKLFVVYADYPDQIRGMQAHYSVIYRHITNPLVSINAWRSRENLQIATRLGNHPEVLFA